ncbi:hypothetical protein C8A00DRAFT_33475 [Chaetomidium leptoderma]|uniref:Uncharacterized protein n=1 Tax=Chaetomidium leptoderma TaxID=669021 RepID=A0AAN6VN23_9PEZI|nr:hypothetical protein C8A00DRAFT_33475 [Chaetomidium leptoderma]
MTFRLANVVCCGLAAWVRCAASIPQIFGHVQHFFLTAPQPIRIISSLCAWLAMLALVSVVVAIVVAISAPTVMMAARLGLRWIITEIRGVLVDSATAIIVTPAISLFRVFTGHNHLPRLPPVGDLGSIPTIRWAVQDSLVAATEVTTQGVEHLLQQCAVATTPELQLTPTINIECTVLGNQVDGPPLMTALRRDSKKIRGTVNKKLAREFSDFAQFLHLLRDHPATVALDPQAPASGFPSRWQSFSHHLDIAYRAVWCRWIRQQPRTTLESRRSQLRKMFKYGAARRDTYRVGIEKIAATLEGKYNRSCDACDVIESKARELGPASLSSSFFDKARVHVPPPLSDEDAAHQQEARAGLTTSGNKDLMAQHATCFALQTVAARCVVKCALLHEHLDGLRGIIAWLRTEINWWKRFEPRDGEVLLVQRVAMSSFTAIYTFEESLDRVVRSAMERGGPQQGAR